MPKTAKAERLSADERRERIIRGATRVFAERGYTDASMAGIARAAGITPAVIYDHFPSKAELHITLLERETRQMLAAIGTALDAAPEEPAARLRAGVDAFFAFVEDHEFAWRLIFRDAPADPDVARAYRRLGDGTTGAVGGFLRMTAPESLLAAPDAEQRFEIFAKTLTAAMTGLAFWWYEHREVPRAALVDRFLEFAWIGLERVTAGERL